MAINKNHEFEDLNGVKCSIVEKNASQARVDFLKNILEFNHYQVVIAPSPPPKIITKPAALLAAASENLTSDISAESRQLIEAPQPPPTFTLGVTDVTFNPVNAIFGRLLHVPAGPVVTLAFWEQKETQPHDDIPYYEEKN